jgi:hypothetical protein
VNKDRRLYARFTLGFPDHPKILILSDKAFRCLVEAILWSREQEKDGFLARRLALAKWSLEALQELCTNDDENPSLVEREEGWYIHDYAEQQETKADVEARRERNRINGQKGGLAKAKRAGKRLAKPTATNLVSEKLAEEEEVRAREFPLTVTIASTSEPAPRCPIHINWTGDIPPCRACGVAREANKAWKDGELDRRRAARTTAKAIADACPVCHGTNWVPDTDPAVKCSHQEAVHA